MPLLPTKTPIILAVVATLSLIAIGCSAGNLTSDHSEILIYGGEPVASDEWRGVVAITRRSSDGSDYIECTGTLFQAKYVLTAGHCLDDAGLLANDPNVLAKIGIYIGSGNEGGKVSGVAPIKAVNVHPELRLHPGGNADIAIIELVTPIKSVASAQLLTSIDSQQQELTTDMAAKLIGFGRREDSGRGQKFMADVQVRDILAWESKAGANGKDACEGDSGGPAFIKKKSGRGWQQFGIVSRTWTFGCGQGGYVTNIAPHACWISSVTGIKFPGTTVQCQKADAFYSQNDLSNIDFIRLCRGKGANKFQRETIQRLRRHYKAETCNDLSAALSTDTLKLDHLLLRDLSPLAPFTQINFLSLTGNLVSDPSVLLRFSNLKHLSIDGNNIEYPAVVLKPLIEQGTLIKGFYSQINSYGKTLFSKYCGASDLTDDQKKTIKAIFAKTLAEDCKTANARLLSLKTLNLEDRGLSDVSLLAGLPHLETLNLANNPLVDVSPLATLENLQSLDIQNTQVTDLSPLQALINQNLVIKQ